ncbi:MAG: hypothetical protein ACPG4T_18580 [Nannocystaceae bacterium]
MDRLPSLSALLLGHILACLAACNSSSGYATGTGGPLDTSGRYELDQLSPTDRHFLVGNETRQDIFYPYIRGQGGSYLGVGSEQNYSLIAASSASLAFIIDIDERVLDYHRMLIGFIRASPNPASLRSRFLEGELTRVKAILAAENLTAQHLALWRAIHPRISMHLQDVARRPYSTWLSDHKMYQHIRELCLSDRIVVLPGDLQGASTMRTIARITRKRSTTFRTIYLSNAEESLTKRADFAANLGRFTDSRARVLRTFYRPDWDAADGLWSYQVHQLSDLNHRLQARPEQVLAQLIDAAHRDGLLDVVVPHGAVTTIGLDRP